MTNKQAKEIMLKLKEEITNDFDVLEDEEKEAFNKAIEALEQEPSEDMTIAYLMGYYADKEPCEDAISREAVIEILENYGCTNKEGLLFKDIRDLPPVRPQEQTGHWIIDEGSLDALYGEVCKCSECGVESIGESDFCPNCGAKMVEPKESEGAE